jgi:hypothetical protein
MAFLPFFLFVGTSMPHLDKATEELVRITQWLRQHNPTGYAALRERLRDLLGEYFLYIEAPPALEP